MFSFRQGRFSSYTCMTFSRHGVCFLINTNPRFSKLTLLLSESSSPPPSPSCFTQENDYDFSIAEFPIGKMTILVKIAPVNINTCIFLGKIYYMCFCLAVFPLYSVFFPGNTIAGKLVEFAPCQLIIVRFKTETEMLISVRKRPRTTVVKAACMFPCMNLS